MYNIHWSMYVKNLIMDVKYLYFFRGLIAFVAFSDFGTAIKAFVENKCILNEISGSSSSIVPRVYGLYAILQAFIMVHCTLFIHYKPLISMGICSLILSILMHVSEAFTVHSTPYDFRILFPCALNGVTILGLVLTLLLGFDKTRVVEDENIELLKKTKLMKKNVTSDKVK